MKNFIYSTPTKVYFGKDEELKIGKILKEYQVNKVLLHYGGKSAKASGLLDRVKGCLMEEQIPFVELGGVVANPELKLVREGISLVQREGVDFILAIGGGSVIDSAKDIANGAANPEVDVWDFSLKKEQPKKTIRKGAILTLAAAGSEMSDSCVVTNTELGFKTGYGSPCNRLDFAIENPELTYTVDAFQTACGAVDIGMHTIERYFCKGEDTYLTDAVAEAIIKCAIRSGKEAIENPRDYSARANMMWASSLAHNGLTQCGRDFLLPVHQFEHEVSGMYPRVAHGAGLAALWCSWARYVYSANVMRFAQYAQRVWNVPMDYEHPEKTALQGIACQEEYYRSIGMPTSLRELGVDEENLDELALRCSRNKTRILDGDCPIGYEQMVEIYHMAY